MYTGVSKGDFWKHHTPKDIKSSVKAGAVFAYISVVVTILFSLYQFMDEWTEYMSLDEVMLYYGEEFRYILVGFLVYLLGYALIMAGLGIGLQAARSRVCAVLLLSIFILDKLWQLVDGGLLGGGIVSIVLFGAIYANAVKGAFRFHKLWDEYLRTGQLPMMNNPAAGGPGQPMYQSPAPPQAGPAPAYMPVHSEAEPMVTEDTSDDTPWEK